MILYTALECTGHWHAVQGYSGMDVAPLPVRAAPPPRVSVQGPEGFCDLTSQPSGMKYARDVSAGFFYTS